MSVDLGIPGYMNNTYQIYIEYQEEWRLILTNRIIYVDVLKIKTDIL